MSGINTVNLGILENSVGKGCKNLPLDVLVIQRLINGCKNSYQGKVLLVADGLYGEKTGIQIKRFQKEVMKFDSPNGLISVGGNTHKGLLSNLSANYKYEHEIMSFYQPKKEYRYRFIFRPVLSPVSSGEQ